VCDIEKTITPKGDFCHHDPDHFCQEPSGCVVCCKQPPAVRVPFKAEFGRDDAFDTLRVFMGLLQFYDTVDCPIITFEELCCLIRECRT
jgi:hypothetical protein